MHVLRIYLIFNYCLNNKQYHFDPDEVFCLLFEDVDLLEPFFGPFNVNLSDVEFFLLFVPDDCFRLLGLVVVVCELPLRAGIGSLEKDVDGAESEIPTVEVFPKMELDPAVPRIGMLNFSSWRPLRETVFRGTVVEDLSSLCASIKFNMFWRS